MFPRNQVFAAGREGVYADDIDSDFTPIGEVALPVLPAMPQGWGFDEED